MRIKKLVVVILLGVVLCFVSEAGYGEIKDKEYLFGIKVRNLEFELLLAKVDYIMTYPDSFLRVSYYYDETGRGAEHFPADVTTKDKIYVRVYDSRGVFSGKAGAMLLLELDRQGFSVCYFLNYVVSDMDNDIVVRFMDNFGEPLGYFYQGEYHLWEE